ncbi:hypothetical protein Hanom_Chr15g01344421 [Helianthus anomalus]
MGIYDISQVCWDIYEIAPKFYVTCQKPKHIRVHKRGIYTIKQGDGYEPLVPVPR